MGVVQLRQIKTFLEANFGPHVDLSDYSTKPEEEQANVRLTRSLAAFAVANAADVSPEVAGGTAVVPSRGNAAITE